MINAAIAKVIIIPTRPIMMVLRLPSFRATCPPGMANNTKTKAKRVIVKVANPGDIVSVNTP